MEPFSYKIEVIASILLLYTSLTTPTTLPRKYETLRDQGHRLRPDLAQNASVSVSIKPLSSTGALRGQTEPWENSRFVGKIYENSDPGPPNPSLLSYQTQGQGYLSNDLDAVLKDPPPHEEVAKMARYVVAHSDWTSVATISSRSPTKGFPFANIFSVSDGPAGKSSGVPYMYLTPLDLSVIDLQEESRASLTMSLAQGTYCHAHNYDPEDPRCAHVILTGHMLKVPSGSTEETFARKALFSRHTAMSSWPKDHGWFFAKLNISNILVLDYFGGAKSVSVGDYFSN